MTISPGKSSSRSGLCSSEVIYFRLFLTRSLLSQPIHVQQLLEVLQTGGQV